MGYVFVGICAYYLTTLTTICKMTLLSWPVLLSVTYSQVFGAPPYNFSISDVGLISLSSFVGALIGSLLAKPIVDGVAVWMAKRNNGVSEPEFRLIAILWYSCFAGVGFFGDNS